MRRKIRSVKLSTKRRKDSEKEKFNVKQSKIRDCDFKSKAEVDHAYFLEYERQMGRVAAWAYEVEYDLLVNGKSVGAHKPDFTVWYPNGTVEVHEIKGGRISKTEAWALRRQIFRAVYPEIFYRTFDKFWKPKRGRKKAIRTWCNRTKRWVRLEVGPRIIQMD